MMMTRKILPVQIVSFKLRIHQKIRTTSNRNKQSSRSLLQWINISEKRSKFSTGSKTILVKNGLTSSFLATHHSFIRMPPVSLSGVLHIKVWNGKDLTKLSRILNLSLPKKVKQSISTLNMAPSLQVGSLEP